MEYFVSMSWSSSIGKFHFIYTDILMYSVLSGEPVYSFELCGSNVCCGSQIKIRSGPFVWSRLDFLHRALFNFGYYILLYYQNEIEFDEKVSLPIKRRTPTN